MKQTTHLGRQIWFKGTKQACKAQAERMRAEQGVKSASIVPLYQRPGSHSPVWALCL